LGDNKTTILIDPFISRPRVSNPFAPLIIDTTAVDELILKPMGDRNVDAILVSHAHADHVMDVPLVLSRSTTTDHSPLLVGDPNTVALVESYHLSAETRLLTFDDGVVHYLIGQFGDFTVEACPVASSTVQLPPVAGP
jgi:L-ascorbate metabolism protein UlaG (beta-lactamase superfamily)